jgi:hypothetical protein
MPLRDHFHPPLARRRHWRSFYGLWASEIVRALNRGLLPPDCFAEATVNLGTSAQVDVETFDAEPEIITSIPDGNGGGVAVQTWAPPAPPLTMGFSIPESIEVQVFMTDAGATLIGAIELVSPRNKDRPASREAFVAKCAAYLFAEVGLIVVDVVTERLANLHDELVRLLEQPDSFAFSPATGLYAVAYRPRRLESGGRMDLWPHRLEVGQPLPILPLALGDLGIVPIDLETTYTTTCLDSRIPG